MQFDPSHEFCIPTNRPQPSRRVPFSEDLPNPSIASPFRHFQEDTIAVCPPLRVQASFLALQHAEYKLHADAGVY